MLVGKVNVDIEALERNSRSVESFISYSDSLVPDIFSHVPAITANQRYLCCLLLRKSKRVSWDTKNLILNSVMQGASIVGYSDQLIEVNAIWALVDKAKVDKYIRRALDELGKRNNRGL